MSKATSFKIIYQGVHLVHVQQDHIDLNPTHQSSPPPPPKKPHTLFQNNSSLHFLEYTLCQDRDPTTTIQLKYQSLVNTLEHTCWCVTLTILKTKIRCHIHQKKHHLTILIIPHPPHGHSFLYATNPPLSHQTPHHTYTQQKKT